MSQSRQHDIPIAYPSYSEDFHTNKTNPALAFSEAWQDSVGRLWLNTATAPSLERMHLFEFNGYEFRLAMDVLDTLRPDFGLQIRLREHVYGGIHSPRPGVAVAFVADLVQKDIVYYDLPEAQEYVPPVRLDDSTVSILGYAANSWVTSKIRGTEFSTRRVEVKGSEDYRSEPNKRRFISGFDGVHVWWPEGDSLRMQDLESGGAQSWILPPPAEHDPADIRYVRVMPIDDYIIAVDINKTNIARWRKRDERMFVPIPYFEAPMRTFDTFSDENGNTMLIGLNTENVIIARLLTESGNWINYDAFFTGIRSFPGRVFGTNFRNRLGMTYGGGLLLFEVGISEAIAHYMKGSSIRAMTQVSDHEVLVTRQGNDAFIINLEDGSERTLPEDLQLVNTEFLPYTGKPRWVATRNGLALATTALDSLSEVFTGLGNITIMSQLDSTQLVLIPFDQDLYIFNTTRREATAVLIDNKTVHIEGRILDLYCSDGNDVWIATSLGLQHVDLRQHTHEILGSGAGFSDSRFTCIHPGDDGRLWLGSDVGGIQIYDPRDGSVQVLNSDRGLANNTVVRIEKDLEGIRWVATYNGVSLVYPDGELMANLYREDGLVESENNRYSSTVTQDGKILIGSISGVNVIEPERVKAWLRSSEKVEIYLTSVEYYTSGRKFHALRRFDTLDAIQQIVLPAAHRTLNISYALSNYFDAGNHQYAYRLEWIDETWHNVGNQHVLNFNSFSAGEYVLRIRGIDANGNAAQNEIALGIRVRAYYYEQWWFYLLCFALVAGLAILWISRLRSEVARATKRIREDKATIEEQAEQLKDLDKAKSRFFTNISHEFRTPLTIISGMSAQILDNPQIWAKKGAEMIRSNSQTLLQLINQILDLRKLQSSELQLQLIQGDMVAYLRYLVDSFKAYAEQEGKHLSFASEVDSCMMDYDPDKIIRVISNLISNAIKYTPGENHIDVRSSVQRLDGADYFVIRVADDGPGIPKDKVSQIFNRYFRVDELSGETQGTGIGLALTKELVLLMSGTIEVESEAGSGTTFIVQIPVTQSAPVTHKIPGAVPHARTSLADRSVDETVDELTVGDDNLPVCLIVEDHPDVMEFIVSCLQPAYRLIRAQNGRDGIDKAFEEVPDLIVSDVMMPEVDGMELCETLKQDTRTDHIPIVLLTAKADLESRLRGLKHGADEYLSKPFEPKELLARLENLLTNRARLQERYASGLPTVQQPVSSPQDAFMATLTEAVNKHLDEEEFGVTQLCREAGLGRTQLHNKVKALTGMSTTEFIRHVRLTKAREMLKSTEMNVSEVSYAVGFGNPRYFSRMYHEKFGEPPSRTRN